VNSDVSYTAVTDPWKWVMSWVDMLPQTSLVTLLEKHFFPRWLQVLGTWLSGPNPNYYEVTSWYQGWKALFPQQLLSDSAVKGILIMYICVCWASAKFYKVLICFTVLVALSRCLYVL